MAQRTTKEINDLQWDGNICLKDGKQVGAVWVDYGHTRNRRAVYCAYVSYNILGVYITKGLAMKAVEDAVKNLNPATIKPQPRKSAFIWQDQLKKIPTNTQYIVMPDKYTN